MRTPYVVPILLLFAALLCAGVWFGRVNKPTHTEATTTMMQKSIQAAGKSIRVELAVTDEEKQRGLGGREALSDGEGMLFIFDKDAIYPFWMKDMSIPIDIVWIAADGSVVYVLPNLSPSTYPAAFASKDPARYVLELAAGWSERHGLKVGDKIAL